jgi:hypothetical protein
MTVDLPIVQDQVRLAQRHCLKLNARRPPRSADLSNPRRVGVSLL